MSPLDDNEVSFDACVATDFDLTGNSDLLLDLFADRVIVSDFVKEELKKANITFSIAKVISMTQEEIETVFEEIRRRNPRLGVGEIGAISVAQIRHAVVASNDGKARGAAIEIGLEVTGSLGILEHAVTSGNLEPAKAVSISEDMISAGAWFSDELIDLFRTKILT